MKTLDKLLGEITPLPWNEDTPFAATGKQYWADQSYRHHAANVLPELVRLLTKITNTNDPVLIQEWATEALTKAKEVKA